MLMHNNFQIDMSRIEELESKALLTPEEFRELGHYQMESGEWPISRALEHGVSLEESKRRVESVIYDHFHARVCA
jgi:hypothetical protein